MKIKTVLAAVVLASASTTSFAGDVSDAGTADNEVFVPVMTESASSSSGLILPAILGLLVLGAVASGSGT